MRHDKHKLTNLVFLLYFEYYKLINDKCSLRHRALREKLNEARRQQQQIRRSRFRLNARTHNVINHRVEKSRRARYMQLGADKPLVAADGEKPDRGIEKFCLRGFETAADFRVGVYLFEEDAYVIDLAQKDLAEVEAELLHLADVFCGSCGQVGPRAPRDTEEIRIDGFEEREKNIELVFEVAVDGAMPGVEALRDIGDARRVVAFFSKDVERSLEDCLTPDLFLLC